MAFILMGRSTCSNCNATREFIRDGKIPVTDADYVMGDLNVDDPQTYADFAHKYGRENFGKTLPYVVVTDSHGKVLASSGGYRSEEQWKILLERAKTQMTAASANSGDDFDTFFKKPSSGAGQ
jgi:thioredoxin-related protein